MNKELQNFARKKLKEGLRKGKGEKVIMKHTLRLNQFVTGAKRTVVEDLEKVVHLRYEPSGNCVIQKNKIISLLNNKGAQIEKNKELKRALQDIVFKDQSKYPTTVWFIQPFK